MSRLIVHKTRTSFNRLASELPTPTMRTDKEGLEVEIKELEAELTSLQKQRKEIEGKRKHAYNVIGADMQRHD